MADTTGTGDRTFDTLTPARDVRESLVQMSSSAEGNWFQRNLGRRIGRGPGGDHTGVSAAGDGNFLPHLDLPAGAQITDFESTLLGPVNAAYLDADPGSLGAVGGAGNLHNMDAVAQKIGEISDLFDQYAGELTDIYAHESDDPMRADLAERRGTQLTAMSGYTEPLDTLGESLARAGDGYNALVQSFGAVCDDARVQIQQFVDSGDEKNPYPFTFRSDLVGVRSDVESFLEREAPKSGPHSMDPVILGREFVNGMVDYVWGGGHGAVPGETTGTLAGDVDGQAAFYRDNARQGLDCSGLVREYIHRLNGVDIGSGGTHDQMTSGTPVDAADRTPGLTYFPPVGRDTDHPLTGVPDPDHVQIFLGDDVGVLEAPESGGQVTISPYVAGGMFRDHRNG